MKKGIRDRFIFFLILFFGFFSQSYGMEAVYNLEKLNPSGESPITFSIGYPFGTHSGKAQDFSGKVVWKQNQGADPLVEGLQMQGEFSVPIEMIKTGDKTRDCHMVESLGLNYQRSPFPASHVCDNHNLIPETEKFAFLYPQIIFNLLKVEVLAGNLSVDKLVDISIMGEWNIHGVKSKVVHKGQLRILDSNENIEDRSQFPQRIMVLSKFDLKLDDFGIIVKPANILGFEVGVDDIAKVTLSLILKKN